jgi:hypothetical protein
MPFPGMVRAQVPSVEPVGNVAYPPRGTLGTSKLAFSTMFPALTICTLDARISAGMTSQARPIRSMYIASLPQRGCRFRG